jgi:dUTP pyrophosphatase
MKLNVRFKLLHPDMDADLALPRYMTSGASGMDICAALETPLTLAHGKIALIPTGFAIAIPNGFEAQIRPRSGLAVKHGIGIINSPGTIDSDYRGEVKIALINLGQAPYTIQRGDRIAQMVFQGVCRADLQVELDSGSWQLDDTQRHDGGFGHTGKR